MQSIGKELLVRHSVLTLGDGVCSEGVDDGHLFPISTLVAVPHIGPDLVPFPDDALEQVRVPLVAGDRSIGLGQLLRRTAFFNWDSSIAHMGKPPAWLQRRWRDTKDTSSRILLRDVIQDRKDVLLVFVALDLQRASSVSYRF